MFDSNCAWRTDQIKTLTALTKSSIYANKWICAQLFNNIIGSLGFKPLTWNFIGSVKGNVATCKKALSFYDWSKDCGCTWKMKSNKIITHRNLANNSQDSNDSKKHVTPQFSNKLRFETHCLSNSFASTEFMNAA